MLDKEDINRYYDAIGNAALNAAKERVKQYNENNKELSKADAKAMTMSYYDDFVTKLQKAYPIDSVTRDDLTAIEKFGPDKMQEFLYQYGIPNRTAMSPTEAAQSIKAADILPLLQGVAKEGEDWYSLDNSVLKKFGREHGYNVKSKEGFAKLLNDIGEQQLNYDRAQLLKEFQEGGAKYWLPKIIYPSMTQEAENAIATGNGGDYGTLVKLGLMDNAVNVAQMAAPSLSLSKVNPFTMGVIDAGLQGVAEAGRQGAKVGLSDTDQSFDFAPVAFAASSGATRPALVNMLQGQAAKFEGETAKQFGRGVAKVSRSGDPVKAEKEALAQKLANYNNAVVPYQTSAKELKAFLDKRGINERSTTAPTDVYALLAGANDVPDIAKLFGVKYTVGKPIDANRILEEYSKPTVTSFMLNDDGKVVLTKRPKSHVADRLQRRNPKAYNAPDLVIDNNGVVRLATKNDAEAIGLIHKGGKAQATNLVPNTFELDSETEPLYRSLFPQKYAEVTAGTPRAYKVGKALAQLASFVGGRVEPTFKLGSSGVGVDHTYKDENWYQKLPGRSKKIIDAAFKKKEDEIEE